jgi:branched-chain amino acid transport system substrate-binding protein
MRSTTLCAVLGLATALTAGAASAEITIGVSLGATGPGASLGIHYKNAYTLMPKTLGGEPVRYIILDDASDPTNAAKNARKLVSEDKVDALMGSNGVPSAVQMTQVAAESKTPMIALTPIPPLPPERAAWTFVVPQTTELMIGAIGEQMKLHGVKTVGYIGFSDTWGDLVLKALESHAAEDGYKIVTNERPIYHNHGTVNAEFIKVGGKNVEGAVAVTGPLIVPEELPANYPTKAVSLDFTKRYEAAFGAGSRNAFAGYAYDGYLVLNAAVPAALKKAKPGTAEFRDALRASLENIKNIVGTHGVYNMSASNHNGLDDRARVLVKVDQGTWRLMK